MAAIDLFKIASEKKVLDLTGDQHLEEGTVFEIPILPDIYGQTPLDMCLGINQHRENEKLIYLFKDQDLVQLKSATNETMAEIIFNNIKEYSYMHSS